MAAILIFTMIQIIFETKRYGLTAYYKCLEATISEIDILQENAKEGESDGSKRETINQSTATKIFQRLSSKLMKLF